MGHQRKLGSYGKNWIFWAKNEILGPKKGHQIIDPINTLAAFCCQNVDGVKNLVAKFWAQDFQKSVLLNPHPLNPIC